jgi:hypothetical protein
LGASYGWLKSRWMEVRRSINGSPDVPLHASSMERKASNFQVLSEFFLSPAFARIAVTSTRGTPLPPGMQPAVPVMGALQEDIADLVNRVPCSGITIIVESSQRSDPTVRSRFSELQPDASDLPVPVRHRLMPKRAAEPGLEVADFIISAAGSQIQRDMRGKGGWAPDFKDVFCRLPPAICLFSVITAVLMHRESGLVQMRRHRLVGNTPSSL